MKKQKLLVRLFNYLLLNPYKIIKKFSFSILILFFFIIVNIKAQNPVCTSLYNNDNSCQGVSNVALWLSYVPGYTGSMSIPSWGLNFSISGGSISENVSAGTATLSGTVSQGDLSYSLNISLSGRTTSGGPGHSSGCSGYSANTSDWYFYTGSSGTLTCTSGNASDISLSQKGGPFEIGTGANLWTSSEYGGAGWFYVNGSGQCDFGPVIGGCSDPCSASLTATNTGPYCEGTTYTIQLNSAITGATGTVTYKWSGPGGFTSTLQNPVSNNGAGTYTVVATYNGTKCTETASTKVVINKIAATPTATVVQPGCGGTTGKITITGPVGTGYTYSLNGATFSTTKIFSNKAPGIYTIVAKSSTLCASPPLTIVINPPSTPPVTPTIVVEQPSCTVPLGKVTVTDPLGADLQYTIGGNLYQSSPIFNVEVNAVINFSIKVKNTDGCISAATTGVLNPVADKPNKPNVVATDPICGQTSGSALVSDNIPGITYTITGPGGSVGPGVGNWANLQSGNYSVVAISATGCTSNPSTFVVNPPPTGPSMPTAIVTPPTCTEPKGVITITSPK